MPTLTKFVSRLDFNGAKIDREKSVIKDVAIVSLGEAKGHNQIVDRTTLEQVRDCAREYSGGMRVKFNPNSFAHGEASLAGRIPVDTIRIKGNRLIGDLHVYKSYAQKEYLFEITEEAPEHFGLSIDFSGVPEEKDGQRFARCQEIFGVTIVDLPAANPTGLFSQENNNDNVMDEKTIKTLATTTALAVVEGLKPVLKEFRQKNGETDEGEPSPEELAAAGVTDKDSGDEAKKKIQAWRAKEGNEPVTMRGLMQFFSCTGGKAARASVTDDDKKDAKEKPGTVEGFTHRLSELKKGGMKSGTAIAFARKDDPQGFGAWHTAGRPEKTADDSKK